MKRPVKVFILLDFLAPPEKVQKFMRHDDLETTMGYIWILDKEMNKAVEQANPGMVDEMPPQMDNQTVFQPKLNPLEIAQKRLATGEITIREYQKISRALTNGMEF